MKGLSFRLCCLEPCGPRGLLKTVDPRTLGIHMGDTKGIKTGLVKDHKAKVESHHVKPRSAIVCPLCCMSLITVCCKRDQEPSGQKANKP